MGIMSIFKPGKKYFSKSIPPKCDYCHFGKRAKDGNKVLCENSGLVDCTYSCKKFVYSPLKRIPVKQLKFVGSLADEDIYVESADDKKEKELENQTQESNQNPTPETNPTEQTKNSDDVKDEVQETPTIPETPENNSTVDDDIEKAIEEAGKSIPKPI